MLKIAVCDDDRAICSQIEDILDSRASQKVAESETLLFYSGNSLIDYIQNQGCHFDLLFLDIEMDDLNGIEVGQTIRTQHMNYNTEIVFVSGTNNHYLKLFDIHPLTFIPKPFTETDIIKCVELAIKRIRKVRRGFKYKRDGTTLVVDLDDIIYFESNNRKVNIITTHGVESFYGKLNDVGTEVPSKEFSKINRSIIVNVKHIIRYNYADITVSNQEILTIAKQNRASFRRAQLIEGGDFND
jgi:DNA-binding LytR/AlgR family response regulator